MNTVIDVLVQNATIVQALLFGAVILACWTLESRMLGVHLLRKKRRAGINALFALCVLPIQIVMTLGCMTLAWWVTEREWGLLHQLPWKETVWVKYVAMFVLLDFLDWVYHYAMHHVPLFWRFHLVHHTDQAIDASTTVREHPGETVVRNGFLILWVFLCGASLEILVLRQTVETVANILAHTSFRLRERSARILGWVLITPNLHHVHHHARLPYTNSNYGDVFSVWDRLFGTLANLAHKDTEIGLDTHLNAAGDDGFVRSMAMPFDPSGKTEPA
jgi:sterol desaturase/sphingolipid hydroxylase (fatty acid hydroxylase superfamily)